MSGPAWFSPTPEDIFRQDAAEWKKRALAAEAKLSGYRRLREVGEEVLRSVMERDASAKARAIDSMSEELATLDVVDAPRDPFMQRIDLGDGKTLEVRLRAGVGHCSTMDVSKGLIEVEALQPEEGRAIGLFFQVLQLADIAIATRDEQPIKLEEKYLHAIIPPFLALCVELGLLSPAFDRITGASLGAHLATLAELAAKGEAASESKG